MATGQLTRAMVIMAVCNLTMELGLVMVVASTLSVLTLPRVSSK
jgi:hypothetical protein